MLVDTDHPYSGQPIRPVAMIKPAVETASRCELHGIAKRHFEFGRRSAQIVVQSIIKAPRFQDPGTAPRRRRSTGADPTCRDPVEHRPPKVGVAQAVRGTVTRGTSG